MQWIKDNKRQIASALFWILTFVWMIFIFCMSAKNATQSSELSGNVIEKAAPVINKNFHQLDEKGKKDFIESLQDVVRTFAHFFEFTLLGGLGFGAFRFTLNCRKKGVIWSVVMGCIYALTDEIHQIFVPGRTFQLKDILVDCSGILLGTALAFILCKFIEWIRTKKTLSK